MTCAIPYRRRESPIGAKLALLRLFARFILGASLLLAVGSAFAAEAPLRVAVYDVAPYGYVNPDGSMSGYSVDLWRKVAEQIQRQFKLVPVSNMEDILTGLEQNKFDIAIGAITITPERAGRVDFSYPAHRSGVAVAIPRETGVISALMSYGAAISELSSLILVTLVLLLLTGLTMWYIEKSHHSVKAGSESSVGTLRDGLYWAVVTMTTVGYGDKTPKTTLGRAIAILWMFGSLVLVSLFSTSLISRLTAERVENTKLAANIDLASEQLAAVTSSSGAEYLDEQHLPYARFKDIPAALDALAARKVSAVVNSAGSLQYLVSKRYPKSVVLAQGLLAPAYMGFALPRNSELKRPVDRALIKITTGPEWRILELRFFQ